MNIKNCCCFTGHRPEKLYTDEGALIQQLDDAITMAIEDGYTTFISGMAKGVDIWAAELVLQHQRMTSNISLICAVPFEGFGLHWKNGWAERFTRIIHAADSVEYVCPEFSRSAYQRRNEWMVDRSSLLIAAYTGQKGGTQNTIRYAKKKGCKIRYLQIPQ